jgi:hypothetical protein
MGIYFENGHIRLAWAIDPINNLMYVYTCDQVGSTFVRSADSSWRDLGGGNILPGFVVKSKQLDRVMSQVLKHSNQ